MKMQLENMVSVSWFLEHYPEWVGHSDDDDVREAKYNAMDVIQSALFDKDGDFTDSFSDRVKRLLSKRGIDVRAFESDCDCAGELCSDEFVMELGVIHLARKFITEDLTEFVVSRSWNVSGTIRVYANDEDDALKRAQQVYLPLPPGTDSTYHVDVELIEQPS